VKVLITGGAGVLGSNLAYLFIKKGFTVSVLDIIRKEEAWRLSDLGISDVNYIWKNQIDINENDVKDYDIIVDCAIGYADRPMGISSPNAVLLGNLLPQLNLLEALKSINFKGYIIVPSSFNALYGHSAGIVFNENTPPLANNVYGWTKGAVELLYKTYKKQYGLKSIITRVGSAFGPRGRSDELPHRLIIYGLNGKKFILRSPKSQRVWTYSIDALRFYDKLIEKLDEVYESNLNALHLVGNKEDKIVYNVELAKIVKKFLPNLEWEEGTYEPGEEGVYFKYDSTATRKLLNWSPTYSLEEGIENTIKWFKEHIYLYNS
jgi:CDP-glucose 4,6-dehydratase